ncbi:hypothetical protein AGMMS49545_00900 [Betaproteobacteria bacterium]|nr:hypothetical protein AGMMS49545_00900 [Betaproteobacteria bacterium]
MTFVNERIPQEDMEKYQIEAINRCVVGGVDESIRPSWTIDRERNIYLRRLINETEDHRPTGLIAWNFFWNSHLFWVETKTLGWKGVRGGQGWLKLRVTKLGLMGDEHRHVGCSGILDFPEGIDKQQLLQDLYDALLAYKSSGIYSTVTTFELELEFGEGV